MGTAIKGTAIKGTAIKGAGVKQASGHNLMMGRRVAFVLVEDFYHVDSKGREVSGHMAEMIEPHLGSRCTCWHPMIGTHPDEIMAL